ncbi:sugar-binding transcriptional regulator [Corynebacterium pseudotuberculosis]|uniref:sugar-binding transcriptional regulator n=1 Tax=Corynebacterium pseudotuberculosis TaxID=1719 RepID=UPI001BCA8623|nr:sugar-binding transcriptional regulator [Corynebacterium pseudotuberculosis]
MIDARDAQAIDAAKLYYASGLGQAEVAQRLGISRPTVSKMLSYAREKGFVTITLNDPREQGDEIAQRLKERFSLEHVRVVRPVSPDKEELLRELGNAGASLLEDLVCDGMSVGISWGNTLNNVSEHLRSLPRHDVSVVQLKGGHSLSERSTNDLSTLTRFARAFNAEMNLLPLPVILDSREAKDLVVRDRHISCMLSAGANADVVVFTVGSVQRESLLLNLGYLSEEEINRLLTHAVGDICSRFYTETGEIADPAIDARTVGISIKDLSSRPTRVLVAGGVDKAKAIRVALEMGTTTHLVTDFGAAQAVLGE